MNRQHREDRLEERLEQAAASFAYPPTPDLRSQTRLPRRAHGEPRRISRNRGLRPKQLAAAFAVAALVLAVAATPAARARILAFLRIGSVRVVVPTATAPVDTSPTAATAGVPAATPSVTPPVPESPRLNLVGRTTLAAARDAVDFPIRVPGYPPELGPPDGVYVQDIGGDAVILIWLVPGSSTRVEMSLHQLAEEVYAEKEVAERTLIEETTVSGRPALWVRGLHILKYRDARGNEELGVRRLVTGHVLIWTEGDVTYRLETSLPLDEARKVAESLQ